MSGNVMKTRRPEPAEVEYKQMRFLIMDRPTDATIDRFIEVCVVQYEPRCEKTGLRGFNQV